MRVIRGSLYVVWLAASYYEAFVPNGVGKIAMERHSIVVRIVALLGDDVLKERSLVSKDFG